MGKNIALLYMSAYFAQPAPEGSKNRFLRTQTNEAAVSALWKDPASRPDKIVALCSDTVRTKPTVPAADGSGNKGPFQDGQRWVKSKGTFSTLSSPCGKNAEKV